MADEKNKKSEEHYTTTQTNDPINHPAHYTTGKIEVIDYIEDQKLPYHLGNAVKYISRAGKKDKDKTVEDLKKAVWYIERYIGLIGEMSSDTATVVVWTAQLMRRTSQTAQMSQTKSPVKAPPCRKPL